MSFDTCVTVCNADLANDLMTSFEVIDETTVSDRTCNGVMFLTDDDGGGWLSATTRTRIVAGVSELAPYYASNSETYRAAAAFFANAGSRGVASYFTIGFWNKTGGESAVTALDLIEACQPCWTHLAMVHADSAGAVIVDTAVIEAVAAWAAIHDRLFYAQTRAAGNSNPSDATTTKAKLKAAGITTTALFYSNGQCQTVTDPVTGEPQYFAIGAAIVDAWGNAVIDPATGVQAVSDGTTVMSEVVYPYVDFLAAGWAANADLSQRDTGYTLAYKPVGGSGFVGVLPSQIDNGTVAAITGVLPDGTVNAYNNGHANAYVQTAGRRGMFPGISVGGTWMDQEHLKLFLKRQIRDELATLFFGQRRIPYDDARGRATLASAVARVMAAAQGNGHFTADPQDWEVYGEYVRKGAGWCIRQESFGIQSAARKAARLAPQLKVCFVPAGATHHVPVTVCALAVQPAA